MRARVLGLHAGRRVTQQLPRRGALQLAQPLHRRDDQLHSSEHVRLFSRFSGQKSTADDQSAQPEGLLQRFFGLFRFGRSQSRALPVHCCAPLNSLSPPSPRWSPKRAASQCGRCCLGLARSAGRTRQSTRTEETSWLPGPSRRHSGCRWSPLHPAPRPPADGPALLVRPTVCALWERRVRACALLRVLQKLLQVDQKRGKEPALGTSF